MSQYQNIHVEIEADVATITLSRPERLNAIVPAMSDELNQALDSLQAARCILLTGAGRAFCSGADLAALAASANVSMTPGEATYRLLATFYNPLFLHLSRLPIPIVVAVNGPAVGIGCSLALMGDFVIMSDSAYLLEAFVNMGLVPDGGASWLLPRIVGKARATQMMMLGERIDSAKAVDWGLVYKRVPDDMLMTEARALAVRLANGPTFTMGLIRQGIAAALETDFAGALAIEADSQRRAANSTDAMQASAAFLEKRKVVFLGR